MQTIARRWTVQWCPWCRPRPPPADCFLPKRGWERRRLSTVSGSSSRATAVSVLEIFKNVYLDDYSMLCWLTCCFIAVVHNAEALKRTDTELQKAVGYFVSLLTKNVFTHVYSEIQKSESHLKCFCFALKKIIYYCIKLNTYERELGTSKRLWD